MNQQGALLRNILRLGINRIDMLPVLFRNIDFENVRITTNSEWVQFLLNPQNINNTINNTETLLNFEFSIQIDTPNQPSIFVSFNSTLLPNEINFFLNNQAIRIVFNYDRMEFTRLNINDGSTTIERFSLTNPL